MPDPQPQALHEPGPTPEPAAAGDLHAGRLRWLCRLPLAALQHATATIAEMMAKGSYGWILLATAD